MYYYGYVCLNECAFLMAVDSTKKLNSVNIIYIMYYKYLKTVKKPPPVHTCGGTGGWRRAVYLDMTDLNTDCPSGWRETGYSKRTCGII